MGFGIWSSVSGYRIEQRSVLCASHGPKQVSFSNLVMDIFQISEFQSGFWDFRSVPQGLEEMLEINKRLFDRNVSENTTLTRI